MVLSPLVHARPRARTPPDDVCVTVGKERTKKTDDDQGGTPSQGGGRGGGTTVKTLRDVLRTTSADPPPADGQRTRSEGWVLLPMTHE